MKSNKPQLKLTKSETTIFDAHSSYKFIVVDKVKIETVESFLKRGGTISYIGSFSDPLHFTNCPNNGLDFKKAA